MRAAGRTAEQRLPLFRAGRRAASGAAGGPTDGGPPDFARWFGMLFLAGYGCGLFYCRRRQPALLAALAAYAMDRQHLAVFARVFAEQFAAALAQLTLLLFCGFCALGLGIALLLFWAKGALWGGCTAIVYQTMGTRGLVVYWLLSILPEISLLLLCAGLAGQGAQVSRLLYGSVFGGSGRMTGREKARSLVQGYLAAAMAAILLSGLSAGLALFFSGALL